MIEYYLWLNDALYLNYQNNKDIFARFSSPKEVYKNRETLAKESFFRKLSPEIFLKKDISYYREEYFKCERQGIEIISVNDDRYPEYLRLYDEHPLLFYAKGDISLLNEGRRISIVGSRSVSQYGRRATKDIATALCNNGVTIVSGLALGVDSIAQSVAVGENRKSICIMPNGFNVDYPAENIPLREEIAKKGLVISEFSLERRAEKYNFRARNRLFSMLAGDLIVTEAGKKSGSIMSGTIAAKNNANVFCVPYPLYEKSGCNDLIADGAYLITDVNALLEMLDIVKNEQNDIPILDNDTQLILQSLKGDMKTLDEIIAETDLLLADVMITLATLEMNGIVKSLEDKYYI